MYDNYLWQPLNEMYYGKHPYFKTLENLFDQLRDFLKRHKILLIEYEKEQEKEFKKREELVFVREEELLKKYDELKKREEELFKRYDELRDKYKDRHIRDLYLYKSFEYFSFSQKVSKTLKEEINDLKMSNKTRVRNKYYQNILISSEKELNDVENKLNNIENKLNDYENKINELEKEMVNNIPSSSNKFHLYSGKTAKDMYRSTPSDSKISSPYGLKMHRPIKPHNKSTDNSKTNNIEYKNESFNNYNKYLWSLNENKSLLDYHLDYINKWYCAKVNMEEFYNKLSDLTENWNETDSQIRDYEKKYPGTKIDHPLMITKDYIIKEVPSELEAHGIFFPFSLEEAKEYDNITNMICSLFTKIFNFSNLKILIMCNAEKENAFMVNNFILDLLGEYNFSRDKSLEFKQWLNKQKVNKFVSDSMSIRFKTFPTKMKDTIICISDLTIISSKPQHIVATLLHEIGHFFAFHLLPIDFSCNKTVQERFADAFAAKFGYGVELIQSLKQGVSYSLFNDFGRKIRASMRLAKENNSNKNDISIYKKSRLEILINTIMERKYPMTAEVRYAKYDEHPSQLHRFKDMLSHLYIELGNQRLSPIKKKELMNDINKIIKEIPKYGNDEYSKFVKDFDDAMYKSALAKYEMKKSDEYFNNYIMRNMLDYIYDNTIGK